MPIYSPLTISDAKGILNQYGIKGNFTLRPLTGGFANTNYLIDADANKYVLTILEQADARQAEYLGSLLRGLAAHHFFTTRPCKTILGTFSARFAGKPVMLKHWVSGKVISKFQPVQIAQVGTALARLHKIPIPDALPSKHPYGFETFSSVLDYNFDTGYENWLRRQTKRIEQNLPKSLPKALIHGDLFFDNILFERGRFKAIIDFERACRYYCAFDLGMTIVGVLCIGGRTIDLKKIKVLISGYEKVRKLDQQEREYLPLCIEYAATATSKWRYWKYNINSPSAERKYKHREMVDLAEQIQKVSLADFMREVFKNKADERKKSGRKPAGTTQPESEPGD